jgi:hypothetical protein
MRMSAEETRETLKSLGVLSEDLRKGEFYYHQVIDNDASTGEAKRLAVIEAQEKTERYNKLRDPQDYKFFDPNFTASNLIRLGAKTVYKDVLYIKISQRGSKDYKSRIATEEDKQTFQTAWELFNEQEKSNQENRSQANTRADSGNSEREQQNSVHREIENQTENALCDRDISKRWEELPINTSGQKYKSTQINCVEFTYSFNLS